ncbi:hypothetical protein FD754_013243 [Muntiacus muntjak]|uniref:Ig-like domain-containing protein n=1 Tax=Muntiacus muntjak TaxID=9888 RepID=A0A5N3VJW3_MUNMU|nr:hypothetical protein FD754_013243 [Muntiacus muntjak]
MAPTLPALLCLGLSVGLRTQVQAGTLPKPIIWAEPGSVVPWGSPVSIWCQGILEAQVFRLDKEGRTVRWERQKVLKPRDKAQLAIPHMTEQHAGRYQCYYRTPTAWSERSEPLELVVTGRYNKPSLSALPSPAVTSGGKLTLQCGSRWGFNRFLLTKEGEDESSRTLDGQRSPDGQTQALFPVGPVSPGHGWTFRCYGFNRDTPRVWSAPSDPLELLVSGLLRDRPSLSARPGPSVAPGENVTLLCQSGNRTDTFLLSQEGAAHRPLRLPAQHQGGRFQAEFSLSPVSSAHGGTYRCYRALSKDSYLLSRPSEPLALLVAGEAPGWARGHVLSREAGACAAADPCALTPDYTVQNLIRMGLAASVLLLLGVLLCQARHDRKEARDAARS